MRALLALSLRAALLETLHGTTRAALERAMQTASKVWVDDGCSLRIRRPATAEQAPSAGFRPPADDALVDSTPLLLDDSRDPYPSLVVWTDMGLIVGEVAETNVDYVPPAVSGDAIAIGCCLDSAHFIVLRFADGVADLVRESHTRDGALARTRVRWWIDRAPPSDVVAACTGH
jgi:hypothetical protein